MHKNKKDQVFISYSRKDHEWVSRILTFLTPLIKRNVIEAWNDTKILPGMLWQEQVEAAIDRSKIAVILVSPSYLASNFAQDGELPLLLDRASKNKLTIVPVAIHPTILRDSPLSKYSFFDAPPLSSLNESERDEKLVDLTKYVYDLLHRKESFDQVYNESLKPELEIQINFFFEAESELAEREQIDQQV